MFEGEQLLYDKVEVGSGIGVHLAALGHNRVHEVAFGQREVLHHLFTTLTRYLMSYGSYPSKGTSLLKISHSKVPTANTSILCEYFFF